jgi:hypothetical protein
MGRDPGNFRIHKKQITVVISGRDHFKWHGYAFGKLGSSDLSEEDDDENKDVDALGSEDECDEPTPTEDLFVTGDCEAVVNSEEPVLDPRVYFLLSTQHRLEIVSQSYEYLVQKLDAGFSSWVGLTIEVGILLLKQILETNSQRGSR